MPKRKSISKKLRFELFKRDGFTCQYCGSTPPSTILEIDHINPVSLGGDNSSDNLITSCFDCNRGKSANELSDIPKSLKEKSVETKEKEAQIKGFNKILKSKSDGIKNESWEVVSSLEDDGLIEEYNKKRLQSIRIFLEKLPLQVVIEAAESTSIKFGNISNGAFSYFCAICWNIIRGGDNA